MSLFLALSAALERLSAALRSPPASTRVPLTNDEIKALRQAAVDNAPIDRNLVLRVCGAALDARKRSRRYATAMNEVLAAAN